MAQFVGDSQTPIASERFAVLVPPTLALVSFVPASPSLVQLSPQYSVEQWQTPLDPIAETVLVTVAHAPKVPLTPPSQGYVTFDNHPAAATSTLGPPPPR